MDVRFVTSDLRHFDALRAEAIVLPLFAGERPLRGTVGLVDWRLCGKLGALVRAGRLRGEAGEHVLVASRPKLAVDKVLLYGVGPEDGFDDAAFSDAVRRLFGVLSAARIRSTLWLLPGREAGLITPKRAMELFLAEAGDDASTHHDEVTVVDDTEAHKAMLKVVERAKRKQRAQELD